LIHINQPVIGKEEIDAVTEVLRSGILTEKSGMGPQVLEFERLFAKFIGTRHAVAVCNGTAALHAALLAAGVTNGDEVIVPSFTFPGTASAVLLCGARPVFADIDPDYYCVTAETIEAAITRKAKAIIIAHLYGMPAELDPILEFARERGLIVIEDAAQAHGAEYNGRKVGSIGDMGCFSYYAGKNMTTGEGGMITTNDDELSDNLRMIRAHGQQRPYWVQKLGHNYHMSEIAAAIGIAQLKKLPLFLEKRRKNAEALTERLSVLGKLIIPRETSTRRHSWHLYTVRLRNANAGKRNKVVEKLHDRNIEASIYYESPLHALPLYREYASKRASLQESEKASRQVFSLPVHPKLSPQDIEYISKTVRRVIA
jgi:dTDP-4-amino-4,6-dideoxygalactose transaminase